MNGHEFLAHVKKDASLKAIPILVLTSSQAERDILESYRLGANCCLVKPQQLDEFEGLVRSINDFWLITAKLPQPFIPTAPDTEQVVVGPQLDGGTFPSAA